MNNICNACNEKIAVTNCDKCERRTCKKCCQRVVIKNELSIFHKRCVPKKYRK